MPPPPPRACFGREELVEKIIGLANTLTPTALVGPGGIGKTSIALTVLHSDRIKDQFGDNRRFIRCDQFLPSRPNFLSRLSAVVGAGVKNPDDLTPLRPFLSSKRILIVLDNAESILDPQGTSGKEIYGVVEELSQFDNIFIVITSRITIVPPDCETIQVPTLTMDTARSMFRRIYQHDERLELVDRILRQLDFHPLSVTLLATVARQNDWDNDRLAREWERRQTGVLRTDHNNSLAATIELSLTSPMFEELGPDARELLGVIAFYPQGIDENNIDWLFPSVPNANTMFDKFCVLSLTYRSNGHVTMLAPLRDHLSPADVMSNSLLCTTKYLYFARLSVNLDPTHPGFEEARWITSEDVNVEHLLDTLTSNVGMDYAWDASGSFMRHLFWYKPRQTVLGTKIEQLPDDHRFKPRCLFELSRLFQTAGNYEEQKRLLSYALNLFRQRGNNIWIAVTLRSISNANLRLRLFGEGIQQAKEAAEIFEMLGDAARRRGSLIGLATLLHGDNQLDAAEEIAFCALDLSPEDKGYFTCECHHLLGDIYHSKGDRGKAVHHYNEALQMASLSNFLDLLFLIHLSLAQIFRDEDNFDDAHSHIKQAKSCTLGDTVYLGRAMVTHAKIWFRQRKFEDALSEASGAVEVFEKVGATRDLESARAFLQEVRQAMESSPATPGESQVSFLNNTTSHAY